MRIFHIATAADWRAARRSGSYTTSTVGRTLADEGFIHAARREQVSRVFRDHYRGVREPLVLLTIDTDRLGDVSWRDDRVGEDLYPHVYGAIKPDAVVRVSPLNRRGGTESLLSLFFKEMMLRAALAILVMLLVLGGTALGGELAGPAGAWTGAASGLAVGIVCFVAVAARRG